MSDNTPAAGTDMAHVLFERAQSDCQGRHERSNAVANTAKSVAYEAKETLIELAGKSGNNGKVGNMREDIAEIQAERKAEKKLITKVVLAMIVASGGSTAIAQAIISALK